MYMQDYIDELLRVERNIDEYDDVGSHWVFATYFPLRRRLETGDYCNITDGLKTDGTYRIFSSVKRHE